VASFDDKGDQSHRIIGPSPGLVNRIGLPERVS
jgi:hypothetical protein